MIESVGDLIRLPNGSILRVSFEQETAINYTDFAAQVEKDIVSASRSLEQQKKLYKDLGEDQLTGILAIFLKGAGYDADHDRYRNGHCDLTVKKGDFEWLAEAKLDKGPAYLMEGFRQLADRYSDGAPFCSSGGVIIYTQKPNKIELLRVWVKHLQENYEQDFDQVEVCMDTLTCRTRHTHQATGIPYRVRHFPVSFYYNPTDKSARASAAKAQLDRVVADESLEDTDQSQSDSN